MFCTFCCVTCPGGSDEGCRTFLAPSIKMLQGVHAFARPQAPMGLRQFPLTGGGYMSQPQPHSRLLKAKARRPAVAADWGVCEHFISHRPGAPASMATSLNLTASANGVRVDPPRQAGRLRDMGRNCNFSSPTCGRAGGEVSPDQGRSAPSA